MKIREQWIIGIDEAGRGPLAGPVTVGAFRADPKMKSRLLKNVFDNKLRDSKKLSEKRREEIYKKFQNLKKEGKVFFAVTHISNKIIDRIGISKSVSRGISRSLKKLDHTKNIQWPSLYLRLDGLLKAPIEFKNQKTIIKGDEKDVFIACASIVAKVSRDRLMCRLAKKYPLYHFGIHKGYGTLAHRRLITQKGLSQLHRITFCSRLQKS